MNFHTQHPAWRSVAALLVFVLLIGFGSPATQPAQAQPSDAACAITADVLQGLGFNVATVGLGFNVATVGLGFNVTTVGLGFNVATVGLGFNVATVGLSSTEVATEIIDPANRVGFDWLVSFMEPLYASTAYNSERVAVIILDNDSHGAQVRGVYEQANAALAARFGESNIELFFVDVSGGDRPYDIDIIADLLTSEVNRLQAAGFSRFVVNMSFGMFPCSNDNLIVDGVSYSYNFFDAISFIEEVNELAAEPDPSLIEPRLLCITFPPFEDEGEEGTDESEGDDEDDDDSEEESSVPITAHFGYFNPNPTPIYLPYDLERNFISGGDFSNSEARTVTPSFFYRDTSLPSAVSESLPYPNSAFQVTFPSSETLSWTLNDNTVTADVETPECDPFAEPTFFEDVSPFVECVQVVQDGESELYLAHFGINNPRGVPVYVEQGSNNMLSGDFSFASQAFVPTVFGYSGESSGGYPNTVLNAPFFGGGGEGEGSLTWTVNGITATATESSPPCLQPEGYSIQSYLTEVVGIPQEKISTALVTLFTQGSQISDSRLEQVLQDYLDQSERESNDSDPNTRFQLVPIASAGNFAAWFAEVTGQSEDNIQPLAPALWRSTIASAATFGNPFDLWSFGGRRMTHVGEIAVPGGTFEPQEDVVVVGTSHSAPNLSRAVAGFLTFPEGCVFVRDGGVVLPPALNPGTFNNSIFPNGNPLNCAIPMVDTGVPMCNGIEATIYVDSNGFVVGGPDNGRPYNGTLRGTNFQDVMVGTDGDDVIRGSNNDDILCGEGGSDRLFGENGFDTLFGGEGDDSRLDGGDGFDTINGEGGNDTIFGGNGNDAISGGEGNDTVNAGGGDDIVTGDAGDDTLDGGNSQDDLDGGNGNDIINGSGGNDTLRGGEGMDTLNGGNDQDILFGDADNDILLGGNGDDDLFGGVGDDELRGGQGNDELFGEAGMDMLFGDNGDDQLNGGSEMDTLQGGDNNDMLFGEDGDDTLFGNNGVDSLDGGNGDDLCDGGGTNNDTSNACETLINIP